MVPTSTFILTGWSNYTITGISTNIISPSTSSRLYYSIEIDNTTHKSGNISSATFSPPLVFDTPLPANTDSFQVTLNVFGSGKWNVKSFTITYE